MTTQTQAPSRSDWQAAAAALVIDPRAVVDGQRVDPTPTATQFDSVDPDKRCVVAQYSDSDAALVDRAVTTARRAFVAGDWSHRTAAERGQVLRAWADGIEAQADTLALMDSLEMGMPIALARDDVLGSAALLREYADGAQWLRGDVGHTAAGTLQASLHEPLGVIGIITPWNFPVNQVLAKVAPALVMGNAVVLKPSEVASASALQLAALALDAGLPAGVLNAVPGRGATTGAALAAHRDLDHLTFTGSTTTGAAIQHAAPVARRLALELGGKSPQVVCASFDAPATLGPALAQSAFWNTGQVCAAGSHLVVHRDHAEQVIAALAAAAEEFVPGDPLDPATTLGPIACAAQHARIRTMLERARADGGRLRAGDVPRETDGALRMAPAIVDGLPPTAELVREEVFGPVLVVSTFETQTDALKLANASGYGLVANVWTRDLVEGHRLARGLQAGAVTVAARADADADHSLALTYEPAGRSGFGREGGVDGLLQYTQRKLLTVVSG